MNNSLVVYTTILTRLIYDVADRYPGSRPEAELCVRRVRRRIEHEGVPFLTVTLPGFGKYFDKCLRSPSLVFQPEGFSLGLNRLPRLLGWLTRYVFDANQRTVKEDSSLSPAERQVMCDAIRDVRQISQVFYKLELPYEKKQQDAVISRFVETESELEKLSLSYRDPVIRRARTLITRVVGCLDPRDISPQHGPGSVSTSEVGFEKYSLWRTTTQLDEMYPFWEYLAPTVLDSVSRDAKPKEFLDEMPPAKVVLVPKDSRGPRLISCEPLENQWLQQGLQKAIYRLVESHPLTRGHVNFTDQAVNRRLALAGSRDAQSWVTLDLKDASDRVSLQLVHHLFGAVPLWTALWVTRSTRTTLPNGRILPLHKFAPMGSAVCFPVEALCFWSVIVAYLMCMGVPRAQALESVYVYGDDIIVPFKYHEWAIQALTDVGLMVNTDKSCTAGLFRESCGCDAYNGVDVTPKRIRAQWSIDRGHDHRELSAYVQLCNWAYERSYWRLYSYVDKLVQGKYKVPYFPPGSTYPLAIWRHCSDYSFTSSDRGFRYNRKLQRVEARGYKLSPVLLKQRVPTYNLYFHALTRGGEASHGLHAVARRVKLIRAWVPII